MGSQFETMDPSILVTAGAATGQPTAGGQAIAWDREGHQASVTNVATNQKTTYVYDADGNRLLKTDQADDSVTLFVGNSEYKVKAGTKSLVRNYSVGSEPVATRTAAGLTVIIGDRNNTGQLAINAATLAVDKRRFTPFGEDLTTPPPAWPNDHGYLDKTKDTSTGTTHLGAREYDPKLGRFLSVDPIMDPLDPQQMNGYAYANNRPVTSADPTGLFTTAGSGGYEHPTQYTASTNFGHTYSVQRIDRGSGRVYGVRRSDLIKTGSKKDYWGGLASTFSSFGDAILDISPYSGFFNGTPLQDSTDWLFGSERGTLNYQRGEATGLLGLLLGSGPRAATMAAADTARATSLSAKAAPAAAATGRTTTPAKSADDAGEFLVNRAFKAPRQVTPGTRVLDGEYVNDIGHGVRVEPWRAHYDEYGRLTARTDFNAGNKAAGIPDVHHHVYEWRAGCTPCSVNHIPGEYLR